MISMSELGAKLFLYLFYVLKMMQWTAGISQIKAVFIFISHKRKLTSAWKYLSGALAAISLLKFRLNLNGANHQSSTKNDCFILNG